MIDTIRNGRATFEAVKEAAFLATRDELTIENVYTTLSEIRGLINTLENLECEESLYPEVNQFVGGLVNIVHIVNVRRRGCEMMARADEAMDFVVREQDDSAEIITDKWARITDSVVELTDELAVPEQLNYYIVWNKRRECIRVIETVLNPLGFM